MDKKSHVHLRDLKGEIDIVRLGDLVTWRGVPPKAYASLGPGPFRVGELLEVNGLSSLIGIKLPGREAVVDYLAAGDLVLLRR